jgi:aryl-alcohol dehydrogenase-like predicted oxidoreductase
MDDVFIVSCFLPESIHRIPTIKKERKKIIYIAIMLVRPSVFPLIAFSAGSLRTVSSLSATVDASINAKVAGARGLGGSDLVVSEACLGTMTWGVQNDKEDAFEQLDYARSCGVNFIDTAELYPVPLTAPEWRPGATEEILGEYIKKIGSERDQLVIATKMTGFFPSSRVAAVRTVPPTEEPFPDGRLDTKSVITACDASLLRLQTDRIDLMQIHWPDRYVPVFGQVEYKHDMKREGSVEIEETASALRDLIEDGKIRYIGLSNETPLGVCEWVKACEKLGIRDKLVSIQNSYSLVDRRFDGDLAEVCDHYNIGLLPWSILAGGLLSGKYREGNNPSPTSRFLKYPEYMGRWSPKTAKAATVSATNEYAKIAEEAGMTPTELAIAFTRTRRFISDAGSVIIGATTMEQLKENLAPFDGNTPYLSDDVLAAINEVHMKCRNPSCYL